MANFWTNVCQVIGPESLYEGLDPGGWHFLELLVKFFGNQCSLVPRSSTCDNVREDLIETKKYIQCCVRLQSKLVLPLGKDGGDSGEEKNWLHL